MLYGDRGNNTLDGIIHTYAPQSENNTRAYIDSVSKATGYGAKEQVNLHDPETLKTIMAAMIKHENGAQPYTIILSDTGKKSDESVLGDNLAKSLKEAMSEQPLKLEITMVNDKGERKTYNAENNGRITTAMNY